MKCVILCNKMPNKKYDKLYVIKKHNVNKLIGQGDKKLNNAKKKKKNRLREATAKKQKVEEKKKKKKTGTERTTEGRQSNLLFLKTGRNQ